MLFMYVFIILHRTLGIKAYANSLLYLIENTGTNAGGCIAVNNSQFPSQQKLSLNATSPQRVDEGFYNTLPKWQKLEPDPLDGFQSTLNKVLFGESMDPDDKSKALDVTADVLGIYPSGQIMRAELFQNKSMVHLPRSEWIHPGHSYLNTSSPDFMQTAVNAFFLLLEGTLTDVMRLPSKYVLRSSRTIAMMKIAREKVAATWTLVKGSRRTNNISYNVLEYYRPLFKYINGREISKLNLNNERILSFVGTHADLDRHQVGIIASAYIKKNKHWTNPKYLNLMNNLLCGVPMKFMRRIPEHIYLQLSHQLFYHIKACDPLQRKFYLAMMTRTQVLGKSNSWAARDVARLGLLLTEVDGSNLSAINPEAMAGITPQVMMEMPTRNLKFITETQVRYLSQKSLNILSKKLHAYDDEFRMLNYGVETTLRNSILCIVIAIKQIV